VEIGIKKGFVTACFGGGGKEKLAGHFSAGRGDPTTILSVTRKGARGVASRRALYFFTKKGGGAVICGKAWTGVSIAEREGGRERNGSYGAK